MEETTNPRPEKVAVVDEVRERLVEASAVIVTEYRGLTVDEMSTLRSELRPAGGRYKVYKNTLARRGAAQAGVDIGDLLVGPTALAFVEEKPEGGAGDVVTVAKVLRDFAKANPELIVKGGVFDGEIIGAAALNELADVEPREVLLAKLAGLVAAPMQQFAGLLQALPRDFAYGLQALIDEGGAQTEPAQTESAAVSEAGANGAPSNEVPAVAEPEVEAPAEASAVEEAAPAADAAEEKTIKNEDTPEDAGKEEEG
jgi:large subunit ribosomal protein L10